jgi:hypothetical protein
MAQPATTPLRFAVRCTRRCRLFYVCWWCGAFLFFH